MLVGLQYTAVYSLRTTLILLSKLIIPTLFLCVLYVAIYTINKREEIILLTSANDREGVVSVMYETNENK